ncbi:MAG: tetratricopeptide repeat protein [Chloroflexota bacterium]|nr:tetratricopeptide repeat protein [Chloroflexota bacterium]
MAEVLDVPDAERAEFVRAARLGANAGTDAQPLLRPHALRIPGFIQTPIIGRAGELASVQQAFSRPGQRLVTIVGPAGVGKTRLAMSVAQELEAAFPEGVFWVGLAPLQEPLLVLNAIAQALGIKETGNRPLLDLLQTVLWEREILLVLDNCEQILGIGSLVIDLLAAPRLRILATSRKRLRVRSEQQVPLAPLLFPPAAAPLTVDDLQAYPASVFFLTRVRETSPGFVLDGGNAALLGQICAALDGLPLALELAAVRIRVLPPQAMLARLHERLAWLAGGPGDLPPHQRTLLGAMAWSYNLLNPSQQCVFRRLGVFSGGFTLSAASAVCGTPHGLGEDLLSAVAELDEWNMLYPTYEQSAEPRYGMLETIREYALRCLAESGEELQMRRSHLEFFVELAEQARLACSSSDAVAWLQKLEREQENFRAALEWSLSPHGHVESAERLGVVLCWFWERKGYLQEARYWVARILALETDPRGRLVSQLRYYASRFAYLQGDYIYAAQLLEASLAVSLEHGDTEAQIGALNTLGWISVSQCDYYRALDIYTQSLSLCRASGEPLATALALNGLGGTAIGLGDYTKAEELLGEALSIRREHNDRQGIARSLNGLALVAHYTGDLTQAHATFAECLEIYRSLGDKIGLGMTSNNLAWVCVEEGNVDEGWVYLSEALELARQMDSPWIRHQSLCYMGWAALEQGRPEEAAGYLRESLSIARSRSIKYAIVLCHFGLAYVELYAENSLQAAVHFRVAEQMRTQNSMSLAPFERRKVAQLKLALREHLPLPPDEASDLQAVLSSGASRSTS